MGPRVRVRFARLGAGVDDAGMLDLALAARGITRSELRVMAREEVREGAPAMPAILSTWTAALRAESKALRRVLGSACS